MDNKFNEEISENEIFALINNSKPFAIELNKSIYVLGWCSFGKADEVTEKLYFDFIDSLKKVKKLKNDIGKNNLAKSDLVTVNSTFKALQNSIDSSKYKRSEDVAKEETWELLKKYFIECDEKTVNSILKNRNNFVIALDYQDFIVYRSREPFTYKGKDKNER